MTRLWLSWLLGLWLWCGTADAVAPVQKKVLPNGLTVLVREDHSAPVVSAQAWVRAGSVTEGEWLGAGLSHVLEHMLFKGTTTRGVGEIARTIEDLGGDINAYTSFEQTVYYIDLPSAHWRVALEILVDCMFNATIPEDELEKEKQVILREMAMNNDHPERRAWRQLWNTAYTTHPYRHPVIGYPDIYNRTTRADVWNYYRRWYVPNNMFFVVVGDVSAAEVFAAMETLAGSQPMGAVPPVIVPAEPPQLAPRRRDDTMPVQLTQVHLAWPIPPITHPDVYALDVLAIVLGHGRSARLHQRLVERDGLAHHVAASAWTPRDPGLFIVHARTNPEHRDAAIAAILDEVAQLNVSADDVDKAIKISVSQHLAGRKTMSGQAADIGNSEMLTGQPDFSETYLANLRRVTPADVQRVARQYLAPHTLTISTLGPTSDVATATAPVVSAVAPPVHRFELPNGVRVLVRPDSRLPLVDLRVVLSGGVLSETEHNNGITKLMARLLLKGTRQRSAEQIAAEIESVGGQLSYFAGNNSFGLSGQILAEELDRLLDVVADVLQNPSFPPSELERERALQLAEIKAEEDRIMGVAQQRLREALYRAHPYRLHPNGARASVQALTRDDLLAFHRQRVVANNIVVSIFGDVNADAVREKLERRLASLPAHAPLAAAPAAERLTEIVRREDSLPKEQTVLLVGFPTVGVEHPDRFALELLTEAWSGQGSRLFRRIRDELGLVYYVGAYSQFGVGTGYLTFYAGTTAEQVGTVERELFAELARLQESGFDEAELNRARNTVLAQQAIRWQDNGEFAMAVALDELLGLGYDFHRSAEQRYRAVTTADMERAIGRYLIGQPHAVVVIRPSQP
ncbi:MAG: pitrilysin family protein [Verrucomicrobiae bacterium]|nr:pitrilysin family protein [Verrucomicrobiae bacterium]